jgi:hypothetical protein
MLSGGEGREGGAVVGVGGGGRGWGEGSGANFEFCSGIALLTPSLDGFYGDLLLACPASRHPSIRVPTKGGTAAFVEAAGGCLPYRWLSGGCAGREAIRPRQFKFRAW